MDRKLQRHRADSLRQHGFLVDLSLDLDRTLAQRKAQRQKLKSPIEDRDCGEVRCARRGEPGGE